MRKKNVTRISNSENYLQTHVRMTVFLFFFIFSNRSSETVRSEQPPPPQQRKGRRHVTADIKPVASVLQFTQADIEERRRTIDTKARGVAWEACF